MSHQVLKVIKDGSYGRPDIYMWYCYSPVYANGECRENINILKDEKMIPYTVSVNPFYKEAGGFGYMKKRGVWHDPKAKPKYYSNKKEVKAGDINKEGVILDQETGVYWNWKKSKAKGEEAKKKGYAHTKYVYKGYVGQKIGNKVYQRFKPDKLNKSGYFEIYSNILKEKKVAPLPTHTAIPEHKKMKPNDLILTTY